MEIHAFFTFLSKCAASIGYYDRVHCLTWLYLALGIFAVGAICAATGIAGTPSRKRITPTDGSSKCLAEVINQAASSSDVAPRLEDAVKSRGKDIYIVRSGKKAGPFTYEQIEEMLKGKFI